MLFFVSFLWFFWVCCLQVHDAARPAPSGMAKTQNKLKQQTEYQKNEKKKKDAEDARPPSGSTEGEDNCRQEVLRETGEDEKKYMQKREEYESSGFTKSCWRLRKREL